MKVFVTGASGFVGRNLLNYLISNNFYVIPHVRSEEKLPKWEGHKVVLDLRPDTQWRQHLKGVDSVVHLASIVHDKGAAKEDFDEVNFRSSINLARCAIESGVKRLVYVSSVAVYGKFKGSELNEDSKTEPCTYYGKSKLATEIELRKIAEAGGLELVILRPVMVYGLGALGAFGTALSYLKYFQFTPFGLVENKRSFVSIQKLCGTIGHCLISDSVAGETFCVTDSTPISTKQLFTLAGSFLGKKVIHIPFPVSVMSSTLLLFGRIDVSEQLFSNFLVSDKKLQKEIKNSSTHIELSIE